MSGTFFVGNQGILFLLPETREQPLLLLLVSNPSLPCFLLFNLFFCILFSYPCNLRNPWLNILCIFLLFFCYLFFLSVPIRCIRVIRVLSLLSSDFLISSYSTFKSLILLFPFSHNSPPTTHNFFFVPFVFPVLRFRRFHFCSKPFIFARFWPKTRENRRFALIIFRGHSANCKILTIFRQSKHKID